MSILSGISSFFSLDIGNTGIRLVELHATGTVKTLSKYAYVPIDVKLAQSDSAASQQQLASAIANLVTEAKVSSKNVAVNLPSNRVFTTTVDMDRLPEAELGKALAYQADSLIPTPPAETKIDWAVIGDSPKDKSKVEVLLTSTLNNFVEQRLDLLESIGLNVIAFEPDSLALPRSLIATGTSEAQLIVDIGRLSTDLEIVIGETPRLTRSIPTGEEAIVRSAQQNLNVDDKQAEQFVHKFGVSKEKLEGQVYQAVIGTIDILASEIEKSIKFFQARYPNNKLEKIIVTGSAATIPEFPLYLANKFAMNVEIGNSWRNVGFSSDRQNELLAVSNQFSVAVGLALRNE